MRTARLFPHCWTGKVSVLLIDRLRCINEYIHRGAPANCLGERAISHMLVKNWVLLHGLNMRGLNMCGDCQRRPSLDVLLMSQAKRRLGLWEKISFVVARDRQSRNSSALSALRCSCPPAVGAVQGRAHRPLRRPLPSRPLTLLDSSIRRLSESWRAM